MADSLQNSDDLLIIIVLSLLIVTQPQLFWGSGKKYHAQALAGSEPR